MSKSQAPTPEQQDIIDAAVAGGNLVITALAGTGKTSTLEMIANAAPTKKMIYIAFNKTIAEEAKARFPQNVAPSTAHSLAWQAVVRPNKQLQARLRNSGRMPGKQFAQLLGASWLNLSDEDSMSPTQVGRIARETVTRFCQSADTEISGRHVPYQNGIEGNMRAQLQLAVVPLAKKYWADITSPQGKLPFGHDHYLKIWALSKPQLPCEVVLLDEAQDTNPVLAELVQSQEAQQIVVGDAQQQMYEWRGAVDALSSWPNAEMFALTQSWRFGQTIADEANNWLSQLTTPLRVVGNPGIDSVIETATTPDAVLCRTNAGALAQAMFLIKAGQKVALVGGGDSLARLAEAAIDLMAGRRTSHPELFAFKSWSEVQDYVNEDSSGQDLKVFVKLVDDHGPQTIIETARALVDEKSADVTISTVHKAKGREWDSVRVGSDFFTPKEDGTISASEIMVAYVAVTRAKKVLDCSALAS